MTGHTYTFRNSTLPTKWWVCDDPKTLQYVKFGRVEPEFESGYRFEVLPRRCVITVGDETMELATSEAPPYAALRFTVGADRQTLVRVEIHCSEPPAGNWREMAGT